MKSGSKLIFLTLTGILLFFNGVSGELDGFKKTSTGLLYTIYKANKDTVHPKIGSWVSLNMSYSTKIHGKDTVLFNSKVQIKGGGPVRFQLPPSDFKGDIYEGIQLMSPGDSAVFIISADSLFTKTFKSPQRPAIIDSNSVIRFFIHLLTVDIPEKMKQAEIEAIKKYIADNHVTTPPTPSGVYIIVGEPGNGAKIDTGSVVKLQFTVGTLDGNVIFSSYDRPEPIKITCGQKFDTPGIEEAILNCKKGTKAKVIVPSIMAFGEKGRGTIVPPYTALLYNLEIVDVLSKADAEKELAEEKLKEGSKKETGKQDESIQREKYLKDNNITVKPTSDGLYYIEKLKGTGPQAIPGKKVKVHYTGTLLNGKKFDSSLDRKEPFEFTLGKGMVIRGWDEGIALMKQGGKATLIIPSSIGYADRDMGEIPPYSTLVFDVELMDVTDAVPDKQPEKK